KDDAREVVRRSEGIGRKEEEFFKREGTLSERDVKLIEDERRLMNMERQLESREASVEGLEMKERELTVREMECSEREVTREDINGRNLIAVTKMKKDADAARAAAKEEIERLQAVETEFTTKMSMAEIDRKTCEDLLLAAKEELESLAIEREELLRGTEATNLELKGLREEVRVGKEQ
ncbi:hypothetical protein TL16_g13386, partial [Triparma laevis f. inornata]